MKNKKDKRKKRLQNYVIFLFFICIFLGLLLDHVMDFLVGLFAGWNQVNNMEEARIRFGDISQIIGGVSTGIVLIVIGVYCYRRLKKKVTQPIEKLAASMREVSKGNLAVRASTDGGFEIGEIQETFNRMVEELEHAKKLREITEQKNQQLYAGIAHDLKTPMTMILGYAKVLVQNQDVSEEDKNRYIKIIIEQTEHTNALLDSLLAYARLENKSYQLKKERNDIAECLRACAANCYPLLEEAGISLELALPEEAVWYLFDEVEMKRVFTNLLTNVVRHNPPQTFCIIQMEKAKGGDKEKEVIQIVIADNGPKIPVNLQKNIFDSFVVGDDSRNTKNGSGLGLSVSKKIVERHGGRLYYVDDWKDGYKGFMAELYLQKL